jgi:hypothetical protein
MILFFFPALKWMPSVDGGGSAGPMETNLHRLVVPWKPCGGVGAGEPWILGAE